MDKKFNTGKAMKVEEINKEDLAQAFHEWSEGSPILEDLFWACNEQEIKTLGSCNGHIDNPKAQPYITIRLDDSSEEYLKSIYELLKDKKDVDVSILKGDPFLMFSVHLNMENKDEIFGLIAQDIRREKEEKIVSPEFEEIKRLAEERKGVLISKSYLEILESERQMKEEWKREEEAERLKSDEEFERELAESLREAGIFLDGEDDSREKEPPKEMLPWELTPEQLKKYKVDIKNLRAQPSANTGNLDKSDKTPKELE